MWFRLHFLITIDYNDPDVSRSESLSHNNIVKRHNPRITEAVGFSIIVPILVKQLPHVILIRVLKDIAAYSSPSFLALI